MWYRDTKCEKYFSNLSIARLRKFNSLFISLYKLRAVKFYVDKRDVSTNYQTVYWTTWRVILSVQLDNPHALLECSMAGHLLQNLKQTDLWGCLIRQCLLVPQCQFYSRQAFSFFSRAINEIWQVCLFF